MKPKASDVEKLERFIREQDELLTGFLKDPETQAMLEEGKDLIARGEMKTIYLAVVLALGIVTTAHGDTSATKLGGRFR